MRFGMAPWPALVNVVGTVALRASLCLCMGIHNRRPHGAHGWYFHAPFSIFTITRARWSRPRWSVGDMLKMPCAP